MAGEHGNPAVRKTGATKSLTTKAYGAIKNVPLVGPLAQVTRAAVGYAGRAYGNTDVVPATTPSKTTYTPAQAAADQRRGERESSNEPGSRYVGASNLPKELTGDVTAEGFKFNLPPHKWSLPLRPIEANDFMQRKSKLDPRTSSDPLGYNEPIDDQQLAAFHGLRRGRIWRYQGISYDVSNANTGQTTAGSGSNHPNDPANLRPKDQDKWGFQFLWNPESISISVSLNMDVTPSANDIFRTVVGAFPGMEYISVKVVIDRTNDFACFKGSSVDDLSKYADYYKNTYPYEDTSIPVNTKLTELYSLGSASDLEYLFKTLNGAGTLGADWTNLLGKPTADIGFIQPAIIALQLGPTVDSLSYVGWVDSLSINHVSFTEMMIPLRTEVNFSMRTITGTGVTNN
jgi:hypothetical protein